MTRTLTHTYGFHIPATKFTHKLRWVSLFLVKKKLLFYEISNQNSSNGLISHCLNSADRKEAKKANKRAKSAVRMAGIRDKLKFHSQHRCTHKRSRTHRHHKCVYYAHTIRAGIHQTKCVPPSLVLLFVVVCRIDKPVTLSLLAHATRSAKSVGTCTARSRAETCKVKGEHNSKQDRKKTIAKNAKNSIRIRLKNSSHSK